MCIIHQKNILHLSPAEERCTGTSIFHIALDNDEVLEILQTQLVIIKVEISSDPISENADASTSYTTGAVANHPSTSTSSSTAGSPPAATWHRISPADSKIFVPSGTTRIRVLFSTAQHNQSITFYSHPQTGHTEFIGQPITPHSLFPSVQMVSTKASATPYYPLEMIYIVPSEKELQVYSSGTLSGTYDGGTTKTFHFKVAEAHPILLDKIIFTGGTFAQANSGRISIVLPGFLSQKYAVAQKEAQDILKTSLNTAQSILEYKLPFSRIYVIFTISVVSDRPGINCSILNISQIPFPEAIDQIFQSVHILTRTLSAQYFTILSHHTVSLDAWIHVGMQEYTASILSEAILGSNESKYELNRDIEYIHRHDTDEPPLSSTARDNSTFNSVFFRKKAGAFMKVLENNLTPAFMHKIMKELLERKSPSTNDFMRIIKETTGKDVRSLFDAYILRSGIPTITAHVEHSRTGGVSVILRQKINSVHPDANVTISGNISIRIYETDSVLDHVLFLGATPISHELSSGITRTTRKRHSQSTNDTSSLLWVRIDPGIEWMKVASVEQADYMFAEQLVSEKDVYGQMEALSGVMKNPSETICGVLERVMGDPTVFYKVSISAGVLLAKSVNEESGYFGFQRVVQYFINNYCIQNTTIVRSNDFSAYRLYFMQKNIASSMALCQLDSMKSVGDRVIRAKSVVSAFLLNLMRYNDNTGNSFDDSFYLADIITALGIALCSDGHVDTGPFVSEIERLRRRDLLFPSHQNILTCAAIKALTRLGVQGYVSISYKRMLLYTNTNNFYKVRMAAYECIIILFPEELLSVLQMAVDEDRIVRMKILRVIRDGAKCAALPIYESIQKYAPDILKMREIFSGDEEMEGVLREIEGLLMGPTEMAAEVEEEAVMHEMSSEEEGKVPRIVVKVFKPLIIKINLKEIDGAGSVFDKNTDRIAQYGNISNKNTNSEMISSSKYMSSTTAESAGKPSKSGKSRSARRRSIDLRGSDRVDSSLVSSSAYEHSENAIESEEIRDSTMESIDVDRLYKDDGQMRTYYLDKPQEVGMYHFVCAIKKSKAASHILQASKKTPNLPADESMQYKLSTFDEMRVYSNEKESGEKKTEEKKGELLKNSTKEADVAGVRVEIDSENTNDPKNEIECLFNISSSPMPAIYDKAISIFRDYFKSAQYDTSSYSTIKYFQAHFEREYAAFFHITEKPMHRIDAATRKDGTDGRALLISAIDRIISEDRHKIFSVPIETDVLKEYKYLEIVKRPLDLESIKKDLESGAYFTMECAVYDIAQIFINCMIYNLPGSEIYNEAIFIKSKADAIIKEIVPLFSEECTLKDGLQLIFSDVLSDEFKVFYDKVNSEEYPQYYKVVKEPMCLSLVKERVESGYYKNIVHFENEFHKINSASLLYNGSASEITKLGKTLTQKVQMSVQKRFPWHKSIFNKRTTAQQKTKAPVGVSKKIKAQK
ncbi:transcription initiation factor TFIID subunit 2 [Nematocida minor]|uniref:transcription initiation factor TFIID subunit 2 n=1 Tax=Nematocida minor TaxID=1912983 RepID=UPI00221E7F5E|nr:transcription initiation factor TFIID subunit 2 [Nematocida minor]KAI5192369.1 transcription initiation factor TFIID subunit 2 [Nematocida minor]